MNLALILKQTGVKSNIDAWASECESFFNWHKKTGAPTYSDVVMAQAYLKIEPKQPHEDSLEKILNNNQI